MLILFYLTVLTDMFNVIIFVLLPCCWFDCFDVTNHFIFKHLMDFNENRASTLYMVFEELVSVLCEFSFSQFTGIGMAKLSRLSTPTLWYLKYK